MKKRRKIECVCLCVRDIECVYLCVRDIEIIVIVQMQGQKEGKKESSYKSWQTIAQTFKYLLPPFHVRNSI